VQKQKRPVDELELLRAENAELRSRIAQFLRFADQSANLVYLRDLDTGSFVYVNDRFEEALGYSRAELAAPGFDLLSLIAADSLEKVRASRAMHELGEDHLPFEFALLGRDGRRVEVILNSWVTEWGGHRAVFGLMTDITPHHQLADQLREALGRAESEGARAESIIAGLGQSIIVQDRDYRITYQNQVNRALFGDHLGELCYRAYEGLDHVCPGCPVEQSFRDGQVHRHVTTVRHGGRTLHMELTSSPLLDHSGRVVAGLKLVRDITEQVDSAEALRRATEELERQNVDLRTLDQLKDGLLRDVSHELKTPVAKQAMQLEILRVQLGEACRGAVAKTLGVIEEGIHRQQRVIRNLLDLARLESGRRQFRLGPVRADEVLARVLEDYRPTLDSAGFAVEVRAEPAPVIADEEMLWHVLSNLVNNAVKFAAREGPRRIGATVSREAGRVVLRIADNGIGMSPEEQARAFDRFYRASASVEGSGVGLSICRSIMEGMGGTVTLESPGRGRGAVATVTLPL
jgi:PAS domain S-box-containing protein